jgi:predicted Zn-dependent protease
MHGSVRLAAAILAAIVLSACAAPQVTREPVEEAAEPVPVPVPDTRPAMAREPAPQEAPEPAAGADAVIALMTEADRQLVAGDADGAAASLERALRIDSRDARLWQRLAVVRLQQGHPVQAEAMAVRSNGLARGDRALMARNWRIIAEARRMAGDEAGAREADARANALSGERG